MTAVPFMHVAFLVDDLDDAVGTFGARLGVEFAEPMETHLDNFTVAGSQVDVTVRCAYSRVGPPYYELIQAQEHGIFGRQAGLGFHHVGIWESDCPAKVNELTAKGAELEAVQRTPEQEIVLAYFTPSSLAGMRIELVNEAGRAGMERWLAG